MRVVLFAVVPLLAKFGAFGDEAQKDDVTTLVLSVLSLAAVAVEMLVNGGGGRRKKASILFFALTCTFLYALQAGTLLWPRLVRAVGQQLPPHGSALEAAELAAKEEPPVLLPTGAAQRSLPQAVGAAGGSGRKLPLFARVRDGLGKAAGEPKLGAPETAPKPLPAALPRLELAKAFGGQLAPGVSRPMRTISIVLPCAEERDNALNTVDRFCERTPQDTLAEIIVVDDGSDPPLEQLFMRDSRGLATNPVCKVKIVRHEVTTGLMAAKLTGGKVATGDVVAFFDCHCSPKKGWHTEILQQVTENPRRMVVPAITDLDMDTFDEKIDSAVNAKCYLTFDADFKWFDDESDFIPTISGGLVAMGREWFNLTGGFDEEMHGWGGENLDQSLRAWLCGGEITRAKSSRIAHMWRTGDARTNTRYRLRARPTNNRGRVAAAWFDAFVPVYRGGKVPEKEVQNYDEVKRRLACRPFIYFLYRFRKVYIEGGVIAMQVFTLKDKATGLCLFRYGGTMAPQQCSATSSDQRVQLGNVDRNTGKCCSGIRMYGNNDCLDHFDDQGPHWYSCDVTGQNTNQQYFLTSDGRIKRDGNDCLYVDAAARKLKKKSCALVGEQGIFEKVNTFEPKEFELYKSELKKHRYAEELPNLPDN